MRVSSGIGWCVFISQPLWSWDKYRHPALVWRLVLIRKVRHCLWNSRNRSSFWSISKKMLILCLIFIYLLRRETETGNMTKTKRAVAPPPTKCNVHWQLIRGFICEPVILLQDKQGKSYSSWRPLPSLSSWLISSGPARPAGRGIWQRTSDNPEESWHQECQSLHRLRPDCKMLSMQGEQMRQTRGARRVVCTELAKPDMSERDTMSTHCHTEAITHTTATARNQRILWPPPQLTLNFYVVQKLGN